MPPPDADEEPDLEQEVASEEITLTPSETADPVAVIEAKIPQDIRDKYDVFSYRNAAVILSETRTEELNDLLNALRDFSITTAMIRTAGGNESDIPKLLSRTLRPLGWHETIVQGDLLVKLLW